MDAGLVCSSAMCKLRLAHVPSQRFASSRQGPRLQRPTTSVKALNSGGEIYMMDQSWHYLGRLHV